MERRKVFHKQKESNRKGQQFIRRRKGKSLNKKKKDLDGYEIVPPEDVRARVVSDSFHKGAVQLPAERL